MTLWSADPPPGPSVPGGPPAPIPLTVPVAQSSIATAGSDTSMVVVDLGSRVTRAGLVSTSFPDPNGPRICVPSVCRSPGGVPLGSSDAVEGTRYPIRRGCIEDTDGVEEILRNVLCGQVGWAGGETGDGYTKSQHGHSAYINSYANTSSGKSVLVVEPSMQSRSTRETLMEVMFERFGVAHYFSMDAAVASLYSIGKSSGIVVDVGYDKVDVTAVLEGVVHGSTGVRLGGFGGHAMTEMVGRRYGLEYAAAEEKKVGYQGVVEEGDGVTTTGSLLASLCGEEVLRWISEIGDACIQASMVSLVAGEREWRRALMEQVYVCGGGSLVAGFGAAVQRDVMSKYASGFKPGFLSTPEYMPVGHGVGCASWYGGHATAGVVMTPAVIQKQCVTKQLYEEYGSRALWRRIQ